MGPEPVGLDRPGRDFLSTLSWLLASIPRGDSPTTGKTCPRASPGLAYICEGLKEQRKGLTTLVLWNNQLTHTGMAFLGMTLVSRLERKGAAWLLQHLPRPPSSSSSAVSAHPASWGTWPLPPALFLLRLLLPLPLRAALPSLLLHTQHHSLDKTVPCARGSRFV